MEPFVKFTGASGLMEQPDNVVIRKMSDMAAAYADSQKAREWIENGDPVVYEMLEAHVPQAAGELMFCTTRINPGTVGREYFMTKGHYHEDPTTAEIYYTVSGRGILLAETKDRRHVALEMRKGSIIHVEPGWAHRTYNTGEEPLVFLAVYPANAGHDYRTIEQEGSKTAEIAMQNMKTPYKGKIIAIQGLLGNTAAIERFEGFKAALEKYPDVELVSAQPADWSDTKAFQLMSNELVKTPDVDAVWAANDSMALGAIQALKAVGLAGKIPVTGVDGTPQMFDAIKNGEATATVLSDAYLQDGLGLAIALAAKKGELNVNELPKEKRAWMAEAEVITKENVDQFYNDFYVNEPNYSWDQEHFFDRFMGPVK